MVQPIPVRARFYKVGSLQYISHLDLVRTMTRNLIRAGIPAWYTEGFNPRVKLTFAMPLSIGTQSECEFFEIRLTGKMPLEEVRDRLNATMTEEMQVIEVYESDRSFREIGWADYEMILTSPRFSEQTAEDLKNLYTHPLVVTKKGKAGEHDVDIMPFIDLKECSFADGRIRLRALLSADSERYLNPEFLIKTAERDLGIVFDDPFTEYYSIVRKEVYLADKTTVFR